MTDRSENLTGKKFGKLTAYQRADTHGKTNRSAWWKCACECGTLIERRADRLLSGKTKSCGCLKNKRGPGPTEAAKEKRLAQKRSNYSRQDKSAVHGAGTSRRYGVDSVGYAALLSEQGGVCAVCGKPPGKRRLAVDHNHSTGEVRGLLCIKCNAALGMFEDSPQLLNAAAAYLERTPPRISNAEQEEIQPVEDFTEHFRAVIDQ